MNAEVCLEARVVQNRRICGRNRTFCGSVRLWKLFDGAVRRFPRELFKLKRTILELNIVEHFKLVFE